MNDTNTSLNILLSQVNHSYRGDCPKCGGKNTFSATRENGAVVFHCFRASCELAGKVKKEIGLEELRRMDLTSVFRTSMGMDRSPWSIPDHFCSIKSNHVDLLDQWRILDYYRKHTEIFRYDPRQDRIVFLIIHDGVCHGAVGRAINFRTRPKWFIYNSVCSSMFVVPNRDCLAADLHGISNTTILVEDCISACVVSSVCDGMALLGTNFLPDYIEDLLPYSHVLIALDKDASKKAIDLQRRLSFYVKDVDVVLLSRDLKYETIEGIRKILCLGN